MKYTDKSITKLVKVCVASTLLITSLLLYTDVSFARGARARGSVRHSTARTARTGGSVTIQPVHRPRVAPRVGHRIVAIPARHTIIYVEDNPYYYYEGVYYVETDDGYVVVEPPEGATVSYLPAGYTTVYVNGTKHYAYGGVHYRPYSSGGSVVYRVVKR